MTTNTNKRRVRNIEKLRRKQGCLTDCVAYLLDIHPQNVPYFVYPPKRWNIRLRQFFKKHGYNTYWTQSTIPPKRGTHIVCGDSLKWKTFSHFVVYRNGKLVYDPNYPSYWKDDRITHSLVVFPFTRKSK